MPFLVQLTDDATGDLEEIYDFIERINSETTFVSVR